MEFAGKEYIYLSKLKKDKIKNLQQAEKENAEDAPVIKEEEEEEEKEEKKEKNMEVEEEDKKEEKNKEEEDEKDDNISSKLKKYGKSNKKDVFRNIELAVSDDGNLSVNSAEFDMDMERDSNDSENEEPAPMNQNKKEGRVYKKEIDVNVCLIKYDGLQNEAENNVLRLYQCQQCKSYLNKYSNIIPENDKYYNSRK